MKLRTIHVGVGGRGWWPVELLRDDPRFEPVAIVDLDPQAREAARHHLDLAHDVAFDDLEEALARTPADAVVVATPTHTHAALLEAAFAAGKHALVEKGMTNDWSSAQRLVRLADEADVKFCVAQNYRYLPAMQTISNLLEDTTSLHHPGAVGIVDLTQHRYRPDPLNFTYPYAMVWDMACHHLDLLVAWLGPVRRVTAAAYNTAWSRYQHPANVSAMLEFDGGGVGHYVLTHNASIGEWRLLLQGDRGTLRLTDTKDMHVPPPPPLQFYPLPERQFGWSDPLNCPMEVERTGEQGVVDAFTRYITEGLEPGISGRSNLQALAACEMVVRSIDEGRPVHRHELKPQPHDRDWAPPR